MSRWYQGGCGLLGPAAMAFLLAAAPAPQAQAGFQESPPATDAQSEEPEERRSRRRLVDATAQDQEWTPDIRMTPAEEVRELVQRGDQAFAAGRIDDSQNGSLTLYQRALAIDAGNGPARAGIDRSVANIVQRGEAAIAAGRFDEASRLSGLASRFRPQDPAVTSLGAKIAAGREVAAQLAEAQGHVNAGRLIEPAGGNALEVFRALQARDPGSAAARAGLDDIEARLAAQAAALGDAGDYAGADRLLASAAAAFPGSQRIQDAGARIVQQRGERAEAIEGELLSAIEAGEFDRGAGLLEQLAAVSLQERQVEDLRTRLDNARLYASHRPGDTFRDPLAYGGNGPDMVVIPLGTFEMGSPNNEPGRAANEGPRFTVRLSRGFAMSRTEITVGQFQQFINATRYVTSAQQSGRATVYDESTGALTERSGVTWMDDHLGRRANANLPVIHVSWNDAKAFVDWLSRETGQRYRLPSEAEFEYAVRAGSTTRFPWGNGNPETVVGNLTGDRDRSESRRNWSNAFPNYSDGHWGPAPVASYPANPFGLHDMVGNVSEWVEDCWHDNYQRAPTDGSAWVNPGCSLRVLRGSSWASAPEQARSAFRLAAGPAQTNPRLGFRVVREF
mgnify:CR=1 FL=1